MLLAVPLLLLAPQSEAPVSAAAVDPLTLRVVAFGDSFTAQRRDARTPWPARLDALLEARYPDLRVAGEHVAGEPAQG